MGPTGKKTVGIVREVYHRWERRVPLTPQHVRELVKSGIQVVVQPSTSRIFPDEQYRLAGATLSDDLSDANVIVGVKQVPNDKLLPDKTYCFFSHTIKAQPENMELLDTVLQKKIRLIDYECITQEGKKNGRRLIAFGRNAGRAGMIAGFRGLGERLIAKGYSTPFVNVGSAYMYANLERAKEAVEYAGKMIKSDGLPKQLSPMTFVFTGNGNVSKGAQEIFRLMPHQMVHPSELPNLPNDNHTLYGTIVEEEFMVQPIDSKQSLTKEDYYANPHLYEPIFHEKVAPYASFIANCIYWDERFPRLLTKEQLHQLFSVPDPKLIGISDISMDIGGSMEFLEYSTDIEKPFAFYNVDKKQMVDDMDGKGVMMVGVDILPSELPRESSQMFGDKLIEYIKILAGTDARKPLHEDKLPQELLGGCITSNGQLTKSFEYIHAMRAERERSRSMKFLSEREKVAGSTCLRLDGHLFDSGLINKLLDMIEECGGGFHLADVQVVPNYVDANSLSTSSVVLQISMKNREELDEVIEKVKSLAALTPKAKATIMELPDYCGSNYSKSQRPGHEKDEPTHTTGSRNTKTKSHKKKKVVCLGAGLVAAPLVEYISREMNNQVHVVSALNGEAQRLYRKFSRQNVKPMTLDVGSQKSELEKLIAQADCVVSILPATMHTDVAKLCIKNRVPLVTASYVSPEMKALDKQAKEAGIPILCEAGLDPGMDHMSAMKVIDEVKAQDGKVVSFQSLCGGLPAPEAADNPIAYKFSWSPRGVLTAALNPSVYRWNGKVVNIAGIDLLRNNKKCDFLPAFAIEQIPNRNALPYADIYGIPDAHTIFRGTLRYAGCCDILYQLRNLGLFDTNPSQIPSSWPQFIQQLQNKSKVQLKPDAQGFLEWLGAYNAETMLTNGGTPIDTFCSLLQEKLAYQPGERDMAIMHHEFGVEYGNGKKEKRTSTFVGYGSDTGDTIMAKTVGVTAAIGVQLVLQDIVHGRGVLTPTTPDIYGPALARLEAEGIHFKEQVFPQK